MPPRSESGISNETTSSNQSNINNSSVMSNNTSSTPSTHSQPTVPSNNGIHQPPPPQSHLVQPPPGPPYGLVNPDLYNNPNKPNVSGSYMHPQQWQGGVYRHQIGANPYSNHAFASYNTNRLPNPIPTNYNQPYMNYPQNSQYSNTNIMPPPNNYPAKVSNMTQPMYPRASQPGLQPYPSQHSYPHQYHPQYPQQNYNKMYFNGFMYPQHSQPMPYGYSHPEYPNIPNENLPVHPPVLKPNEYNYNPEFSNANQTNSSLSQTSNSNTNNSSAEASTNLNNSLNKSNVYNNQQQSPISSAIIDEASQASTSSSQAEDRSETPKLKQISHPTTPNPLGSPGAASMSSLQDEYDNSSNPSWPRTPSSPVVNTEHSKNKKGDGLQKLYEMSDEPERKIFLDKLVQFYNENGVTLNSCPHISKNLIDLFKLYCLIKDKGGFVEVTKKKLWKECAHLIKMPIASTTSYTLRKQYIKHLLPFECKFDRGGVDFQSLLSSLENSSKRKSSKNSPSPLPADTNSQSSYPQATTPQLNSQQKSLSKSHSSSQSSSPQHSSTHLNTTINQNSAHQPTSTSSQGLANQQLNALPTSTSSSNQSFSNSYPSHVQSNFQQQHQSPRFKGNGPENSYGDENYHRKMSSFYEKDVSKHTNKTNLDGQDLNKSNYYYPGYDIYNRNKNNFNPPGNPYPNVPTNNRFPSIPQDQFPNRLIQPGMSQNYPNVQDSYRPNENYQNINHGSQGSIPNPNFTSNINSFKGPTPLNIPYPKRHPDFSKMDVSNYPNANFNQSNYTHGVNSQFNIPVNPLNKEMSYPSSNEYLPSSYLNNYSKNSLQTMNRSPYDQQNKVIPHTNYSIPSVNALCSNQYSYQTQPLNQLKDVEFPSESIEAVKPIFFKRKKLTAKDLSQIDPWKLMMSLKSGLLAETTWALDVLSILLHDDSTYLYFNLQNLPGLLELLLEHYKLYLSEIFDDFLKDIEDENNQIDTKNNNFQYEELFIKKVLKENEAFKKKFETEVEDENNLNEKKSDTDNINSELKSKKYKKMKLDTLSYQDQKEKSLVLKKSENYTLKNRNGLPVYFVDDFDSLFIKNLSKDWDKTENSSKNMTENWKKYFFTSTDFIQRTFQPSDSNLQFVKVLNPSHTNDENDIENKDYKLSFLNNENSSKSEKFFDEKNDSNEDNNDLENEKLNFPKFREKIKLKKFLENEENEAYVRDSPPLCSLNDYRESISQKCICFSTLIRNLSFIPGNDVELSKNTALLFVLGKLLLLHHKHSEKKQINPSSSTIDDSLFNEDYEEKKHDESQQDFTDSKDEWWWDTLVYLRENALVTISNISGSLNLSKFSEEISLPIFSALLHWTVCQSATALDNFKTSSISSISPSRLSLECLVKLSILEDNVDLMLTTPPWNRDTAIYETLVKFLRKNEEQTLREFSLVLLYNFAIADPNIARSIAVSTDAISQLIGYIEFAEFNALNLINSQGIQSYKDSPEIIGTTLDMIKRAALCLRCLAKIPENQNLFFSYQQRLVQLVMSNIFDQSITSIIADVVYEISLEENTENKNLGVNTEVVNKEKV